jgi:hypothetical protein
MPGASLKTLIAGSDRSLIIDFWGLNATLSLSNPSCTFSRLNGINLA